MNSKTPEYQSGSCNIGPAEIRRRQRSGIIGSVVSLAYWIVMILLHAPTGIRAFIFLPLVLAATGWLQSRRKFCLAFGFMGVFNFGKLGEASRVQDPVQRAADRSQAFKIFAQASALAAVFALVFTFIPA